MGGKTSPQEKILELSGKYGKIVDGEDEAYPHPRKYPARAWMRHYIYHSGDKEGMALIQRPNDQEEVGKAFFLLLSKITMSTADMVANGMSQNAAKARMEEVNGHFCRAMMGIPPQFDDDNDSGDNEPTRERDSHEDSLGENYRDAMPKSWLLCVP